MPEVMLRCPRHTGCLACVSYASRRSSASAMANRWTPVTTSAARHQFDATMRPDPIAVRAAAAASSGLPALSNASARSSRADAIRLGRAPSASSSPMTSRATASAAGSPAHASVVAAYEWAFAGSYR